MSLTWVQCLPLSLPKLWPLEKQLSSFVSGETIRGVTFNQSYALEPLSTDPGIYTVL